jgi:hypothetical protein
MEADNSERRSSARLEYQTQVTIENFEVGVVHDARLGNFSQNGLYFESDFFLVPGTQIFLGISSSPFAEIPGVYECYRSAIRWRKYLDDAAFDYGYGIELISKLTHKKSPGPAGEARKHQRKACAIPTLIECNRKRCRGVIQNASSGGVFIKCSENLEVGQKVFLTIPLKNRQKVVTRVGEIVWMDPAGIGIRFTPPSKRHPASPVPQRPGSDRSGPRRT